MKQRAFTLMELMIVIVIIGILSAVGMVMFGGQAEKAKIAATKQIHVNTVKYITTELMKCDLGETDIFEGIRTCSTVTARNTIATVIQLRNPNQTPTVLDDINPHCNLISNPSNACGVLTDGNRAIQNSGSFVPGQVSIVDSGSTIIIRSCFKAGCATTDTKTSTITVE